MSLFCGRVYSSHSPDSSLFRFCKQADHLRQETLQQMSRILNTHQAAQGLLALGEYFERLRALSSNWATRLQEPAS